MRRSIKFIKQHDARDCGPTCLRMLAWYYGKQYSIDTLRELTSISKSGVSLLSISKAAENIGFRTIGGMFSLEKLANSNLDPYIVHWNQNHFVIVYKIKKKRNGSYSIYVADPGKGLLNYSKEEFLNNWLSTKKKAEEVGVALLFEPTNSFFERESEVISTKSQFRFLFNYFIKYKRFFRQLLLGLGVGSLLQLIFPFLTQAIVDVGIKNKDVHFIWLILIGQLMLLLSRTSIDFIRRRVLLHISSRINISMISDFFIKLMKLPMNFFDKKLIGDLVQRIKDHYRIEMFLTAQTLNMLFSVFTFLVFGIVLLIYNLKIFSVFIISSFLYGIWGWFFLKRRKILDYKNFEKQAINQSKIYQLINGMQEIKLQGCQKRKRWEWEDTQAELFYINQEILTLQQTQEAGSIAINEIKNIIITILAASAVIKGELTLGMMLSIQYIIGQLNTPIDKMMDFIYKWQDVNISLERVNEVHLKLNEESPNRIINLETININKTLIFDNVCFKYEGSCSNNIIHNMNLVIPEKKVTAIVGASGSGKTTLIKLLLGYYQPTRGRILIGNQVLTDINLESWREICGSVMQDGYIFSESIARNIAVSDNKIDIERLKYAAKMANVDEIIERLPLAYNTIIGQEGQGISQGQRQRILIARAIYKNPSFIFLDEATNSLDANNEKLISENLEKFYQGKTVIVVAHRLSTVKNADNIVVLERGSIIEQGNHLELTAKKGSYFELVKNQLELGQ